MTKPYKRMGKARIVAPGGEDFHRMVSLTGEIVIDWADLEELLAFALGRLAQCDQQAADVLYYTPSNFSARLEIIRNLVTHCMPEGPEARLLKEVIDKIEGLSRARNRFVHSALRNYVQGRWDGERTINKAYPLRRYAQPGRQTFWHEFKATPGDLDTHLDQLSAIYNLLFFFTGYALGHHPARAIRRWESIVLKT